MQVRIINIGQRFGSLQVERLDSSPGAKDRKWSCICFCGNRVLVTTNHLLSGHTRSCGCFRITEHLKRSTKHGHSRRGKETPEYNAWLNIKQRTTNRNRDNYKYYGGRNIQIVEDWKNSFDKFLAAVGQRPDSSYSIDRVDNNRGYEPGNIRWATRAEQVKNRRPFKIKRRQDNAK